MSPETERELLNYLAQGKEERVSMFDQLKGLGNAAQRILHQLELHQQKDDAAFESLRYDIKGISARVADLERDVDSTGNYNLQELKGQLDERKKADQTLKAALINAGLGATITLVGALLALVVRYLLSNGK
jgi:hypothetical protein